MQNSTHKLSTLIKVAQYLSPHGLDGTMKFKLLSDSLENFYSYKNFCDQNYNPISLSVKSFIKHKNILLLNIKNINSIDECNKFKNQYIFVAKQELNNIIEKNHFYACDLVGINIYSNDKKYGFISNSYNYGAGDIIEITKLDDKNTKELYSFTEKIFPEVNITKGIAILHKPIII